MEISAEVVEHFRNLLKIDTSNPPGREWAALMYLKDVLEKEGLQVLIQETAADRGNLVVRIRGNGEKKPFLISSHVDVVNAEPEKWKHPPFSATVDEGWIYGRGAVDMKNFTAMCLGVILQATRQKWSLKRDLIMSAVSDEEAGGKFGIQRLVNEHPDWIQAEYALGEVGAATHHISGKRFYPIQVGEKGVLWLKAHFRGEPGHGSVPKKTNAHWRMGQFLSRLEGAAFPMHLTKSSQAFLEGVAGALGPVKGLSFQALKSPMGPKLLKAAAWMGDRGNDKSASLLAMVTNTVNPTGSQSGRQLNVIPSTATLNLDCRVIPGCTPEQVIAEIREATGVGFDPEVINFMNGHESPLETPLYKLMAKRLEESDPGATAVPMLTVGFTDASYMQKLGIICYGYVPLKLPADVNFSTLYHGHNERVPIDGFKWGYEVFSKTVHEFCC